MLFSLFKYNKGEVRTINIGDTIQSLACAQFYPRIDYFVDRDNLEAASEMPKSFLIANAWYKKGMREFPPPENIKPFYISIHISGAGELAREVVEHFKAHSPIGCRDNHTLKLLEKNGIDCYLSGCLTITLGPREVSHSDRIFIVDLPQDVLELVPEKIKTNATFLSHRSVPKNLPMMLMYEAYSLITLRGFRDRFCFFKAIMDYFGIESRKKFAPVSKRDFAAELHMIYANKLLDRYAGAKLVVTSRIHCAIPCLAMGVPVVLIKARNTFDPSRLEAYEMFQEIYSKDHVGAIDWNPAPIDVSERAKYLSNICSEAVKLMGNPLRER